MNFRQRVGLELQRQLRKTNEQLHPMRSLFWECTLRCNMHCRHCGSDCRVQPEVKDMPAADFLRAVDSLTPHVNPNETFIIITGGEALLRDDLEEVGLELYRRGYPWGVVTNGYLLDRVRLQSLMESGLHSVTVSLDGLEEEHNWLRQRKDSFARATEAIGLLAARHEVLWDVVTCVNPRNVDRLAECRDLLVRLGVTSWRLFSIFPMGRAAGDPDLQLTDKQLRRLMDFIEEERRSDRTMEVSYACEGFLGDYEQRVRDHFFYCRSGVEVASIRCDGAISGCTSVRSHMDQGSIYTDDLWGVWQNRFQLMRDRSWARKGHCADCKMWRYCEGSGLHLYDDNGDLLTCHYRRLKE
ncbi:MAG: TIGR04133 family radical SAM/SPASM protein [Bacteroidales bacterium]|nr:TIGR04133 family radical SAM/SPASM protein [Bacteroidales bacterium]